MQTLIRDPILIRLLFSLGILITFTISKHFLSTLLLKGLTKIKIHQKHLEAQSLEKLNKPLYQLLTIASIYLALVISPFVYFHQPAEQTLTLGSFELTLSVLSIKLINKLFGALFVGVTTKLIYDLEHLYEKYLLNLNTKLNLTDNTIFIQYLLRIVEFTTITLGAAICLVILIPNFSGIVTGVGIGGVAIAYVAKDSLASMFSGMILLLDKPFIIGDWIAFDGIEGIVEDISFRSTRIRSFDQGLIVIPNNTIGNANIINWSRMKKRRVIFNLGLSYHTPSDAIDTFMTTLKTYLKNHEQIETDSVLVNFTNLGDYTLDIQIIYYSLVTDLASYLHLKESVNLEILNLCSQQNLDIAFPTQTLEVHQIQKN